MRDLLQLKHDLKARDVAAKEMNTRTEELKVSDLHGCPPGITVLFVTMHLSLIANECSSGRHFGELRNRQE